MEERDNWDNLSHGQEYKQPDGWSEDSELEEIRRAAEEWLREDKERQMAEKKERKKAEQDEEKKDEEPEDDETQEDDSEKVEEDKDGDEAKNQDERKTEEDDGNEVEKPEINLDFKYDVENVEGIGKSSSEDPRGEDGELKDDETETAQEGEIKDVKGDAETQEKNELKKLRNQEIKNMKGKKKNKKIEGEKYKDDAKPSEPPGDIKGAKGAPETAKPETPSEDSTTTEYSSTDSNVTPESNLDQTPKADSKPDSKSNSNYKSTPEPDYTPPTAKAKRLVKREEQDSLDEASTEQHTDPEWRARAFSAEKEAFKSFADCREACAADNECFQFAYYDRTCRLSTSFRLGAYRAPELDVTDEEGRKRDIVFKSGWMMERIREWTENNPCTVPEWPVVEY